MVECYSTGHAAILSQDPHGKPIARRNRSLPASMPSASTSSRSSTTPTP